MSSRSRLEARKNQDLASASDTSTSAREQGGHGAAIVLLGVLALILLGYFLRVELQHTAGVLGVPLDDAWIHYQFARNLRHGHGFSYNPGEPTPGSTAPLWTLLLAGIGWFTEEYLTASLVLSALFFLLTITLTYGLAHSLARSRRVAFLAAMGVAMTGRLLWAGLAGMETTAFAALSVAAVWAYTLRGLRPLAVLLFALASQIRPEGHALFAIAIADFLWSGAFRRQARPVRHTTSLLGAGLLYALVAAPYAMFSLATTGQPLPNTFYAKSGTEHLFSWRAFFETVRLHWFDNPVSVLLVPLGLLPAWRRGRLVSLWLLLLPVFTAVIVDFVWHHGRYTVPLIPFQMLVAALGGQWLLKRVATKLPGTPALGATTLRFLFPSILVAMFVVGNLWQLPNWASMLGENVREIQEIDVSLGKWLMENTPGDAFIAVDDIGAITFLSQRRIVDLNGLISPEMWPAVRAGNGLASDQIATRILSRIGPDFIVVFPLWHWNLAANTTVAKPVHRVETATNTIIGGRESIVYGVEWPYIDRIRPYTSLDATLGEGIRLLGFSLPEGGGAGPLQMTLYWFSVESVSDNYDVFVHVVDTGNQIVAQIDQKPVGGLAPTFLWEPGDIIKDLYEITLAEGTPAGVYSIFVGMYDRNTGSRAVAKGDRVVDNSIFLTELDWRQ